MRHKLKYIGLCLLIFLVMLVPGCNRKGPITVASFQDTETALLAQMIILMLRADGFEVNDDSNRGSADEVRELMSDNKIDIYLDYTGSTGQYYFQSVDKEIWKDAEKGYQTIKELDEKTNNFVWLRPAPANDIWAIAIPRTMAEEKNLWNMEQFADYVNRGEYIRLAASEAFATEESALPAYQKVYGFSLREEQIVTVPGDNSWDTEKKAAIGSDGVNAAMAYGTDGYLESLNLVILEDTKEAQIVFAPAPVVRGALLKKHPEIEAILAPVFASLDDETLRSLNSRTGFIGGEVNYLVARDYLMKEGFLKEDPSGLPPILPTFTADLPDPEGKSKEILNVMMVVGPNSLVERSFTVDQNEEHNARVVGWFMASGGALNDIRVLVLDDIDFINWNNLHTVQGLYKTDKLTTGKIDVSIVASGTYHLVFDNRFSQFTHKYILAKVYLYWSDK